MLAVDWRAPWLEGWRAIGQPIADRVNAGQPLHEALDAAAAPVRFVAQDALPAGVPYEQYIFDTRRVPTREGLHDFFNGLCWLRFPLIKTRLNELQAQQLAIDGVRPMRGAVRDALTLFDENAAFLDAPQPLWDALAARDWPALFIAQRALWRDAKLVPFGHALLEKLAQAPRKPITAHVLRLPLRIATDARLDADVAARLDALFDATLLAQKPFVPLPVLGVPGWWAPNENFSFYDDSLVFRPRRPA